MTDISHISIFGYDMRKLTRYFFLILGFGFVGIGAVGVMLPVVPTVPFMILALWCFARSSERFHKWLYHHKLFGRQLQLWDKYKVIPPVGKIISISSMAMSFAYISIYRDLHIN